jgi:NitT/TauT family transport system permease protein
MGILGVLLVWFLSTASCAVDKLFLPSPLAVWQAGQTQWSSGILLKDALASIQRVFLGFALSAGVALPVGIAMGTNPVICRLLEPLIGLIRYMPAPAFIPLLIIYFGLEELPKVLLIFIGTVFFNTLMIMDAVKFVPRELVETALTLGGRRPQVLTRVIAPCIAPQVLDAYRINMASAWNLVIVAELFRRHPDHAEGDLAKLRNSIVNSHALAGVARDLTDEGLGEYLLLGRGETITGGHAKSSILADTVESLIGAVYLEHGLPGAQQVILRLFEDLLDTAPTLGAALEWKSSLQELTAARGLGVPRYEVTSEGPDHERRFSAAVYVGGEVCGRGAGQSKKVAETNAAAQAWTALDADSQPVVADPDA